MSNRKKSSTSGHFQTRLLTYIIENMLYRKITYHYEQHLTIKGPIHLKSKGKAFIN